MAGNWVQNQGWAVTKPDPNAPPPTPNPAGNGWNYGTGAGNGLDGNGNWNGGAANGSGTPLGTPKPMFGSGGGGVNYSPAQPTDQAGWDDWASRNYDENGKVMPEWGGDRGQANLVANNFSNLASNAQGRSAPLISTRQIDQDRGMGLDSRSQGQDALSLQRDAAYGNAPSAAQMQMQQGNNDAIAAQMAMANSARGGGGNIALAQRQAAASGQQMQMQNTNQAGILRAQEMAQARGAYSQAAMQQRAQDLQAQGLDAQQAEAQAQLELSSRGENDQASLGYYGLGNATEQAQLQADIARYTGQNAGAMQAAQNQANTGNALISGGTAAMVGAGMAFAL